MRREEQLMSFSLGVWKRRLRGGLMVSCSSLVSGGAGTDLCSLEVGPEGNGLELHQGRVRLWNRLSKEVLMASSLLEFKECWGNAVGVMV